MKTPRDIHMTLIKKSLILQLLIFLIPLNIYVIGDWIGSGIQTLFFRYQETSLGNGFIFLHREIGFIFNGIISGKSAIASMIWMIGVVIICIAMLLLIAAYAHDELSFVRYAFLLNIGGALLFTIAILIQYGITLQGSAGIAIPIGIPIILAVAYMQYRWYVAAMNQEAESDDGEPDGEEESEIS